MQQVPVLLLALLMVPATVRAADPTEKALVDRVNIAIEKGKKFLRTQVTTGGNWEIGVDSASKPGGWSSLVVLALLYAGEKPDSPIIVKALDYLRTIEPDQTYVVGLQTMVFAAAGHKQDLPRIQRNVDWLVKARINQGDRKGWSYRSGNAIPDGSNTQYALLGLHEGFVAGAKVDPEVWDWIRKWYSDDQNRNTGGWMYRPSFGESLTMTTAGLCGLLIASMDARANREHQCGAADEDPQVELALQWIASRLPGTAKGFANVPHLYYMLYGLERAGRLSGRRFFGPHDWYRLGCEFLVDTQDGEGFWKGDVRGLDGQPLLATSFSLLFLSKGRTPVLISKLAHGPMGSSDWNNDRYDVRNLTDFTSRELFRKQPLAWQVFDIRMPRRQGRRIDDLAADLLQSPILFLNGHKDPDLENSAGGLSSEGELLRQYVENGGFVVAEACCGKEEFAAKFRKQIKKVFPNGTLEPIPADHPIWTASGKFRSSWRQFKLEGISMGCRTAVIFSPDDLSCIWESNQFEDKDKRPAFEMGANIVAYATGLEPPVQRGTKIEMIKAEAGQKTPPRGSLKVAQIRHGRNWQPAPHAMTNLMLALRSVGLKNVVPETEEMTLGNPDLLDFKFLYMHGRDEFSFAREDLGKLRFNLESGGVLLADACCGSKRFDESFRKFMADLWQDSKLTPTPRLEPIPLDDELFSRKLNGEAITQVRCRRQAGEDNSAEAGFALVEPELEGVKINGRWAVIYSKYDIGCALEKSKSSDCLGHDFESAKRLAMAAVLYALKR